MQYCRMQYGTRTNTDEGRDREKETRHFASILYYLWTVNDLAVILSLCTLRSVCIVAGYCCCCYCSSISQYSSTQYKTYV